MSFKYITPKGCFLCVLNEEIVLIIRTEGQPTAQGVQDSLPAVSKNCFHDLNKYVIKYNGTTSTSCQVSPRLQCSGMPWLNSTLHGCYHCHMIL